MLNWFSRLRKCSSSKLSLMVKRSSLKRYTQRLLMGSMVKNITLNATKEIMFWLWSRVSMTKSLELILQFNSIQLTNGMQTAKHSCFHSLIEPNTHSSTHRIQPASTINRMIELCYLVKDMIFVSTTTVKPIAVVIRTVILVAHIDFRLEWHIIQSKLVVTWQGLINLK